MAASVANADDLSDADSTSGDISAWIKASIIPEVVIDIDHLAFLFRIRE
jgi:hypothetical protein